MAEMKITKAMWFEMIKAALEASEAEDKDGMIAFIEHEQELLSGKAEKAKERAAKARAASDGLKSDIQAVLTEEFQTVEQIEAAIDSEKYSELTRAKIVARLSALVRDGVAEKEATKVEGSSRKVMAYRIIATVEE